MDAFHPRRRPAVLLGVLAAFLWFGAFMAIWYAGSQRLRDGLNYAGRVPQLIEAGQSGYAVEVARIAVERNPLDVAARLHYARALMADGETKRALRQYELLVNTDEAPNPNYDPERSRNEPRTLPTVRPFYNTAARVDLGSYYLANDQPLLAVVQFELARGLTGHVEPSHSRAFFEAYAGLGAWGRAADYVSVTTDFESLPAQGLETIISVLAHSQKWDLCRRAASVLGNEDGRSSYWMGRAYLGEGDVNAAVTPLQHAVEEGVGDASFYLGNAFDLLKDSTRAIEAYKKTPADSPYRLFSVGRAVELLAEREEPAGPEDSLSRLQADLERLLNRPLTVTISPQSNGESWLPAALSLTRLGGDSSPLAMARVIWKDTRHSMTSDRTRPRVAFEEPDSVRLQIHDELHELRTVRNTVTFGAFQSMAESTTMYPGWLEREQPIKEPEDIRIEFQNIRVDEGQLRVRCPGAERAVFSGSVMAPIPDARHWLMAVRCRSAGARLFASSTWFDSDCSKVYSNNIANRVRIEDWKWVVSYDAVPSQAEFVQATLGVFREEGEARFEEIWIVPCEPPREPAR